jgi:folate-binding protein YgfZ
MANTWLDFLAASGAQLADSRVQHFGQPRAELAAAAEGDVMADLSHLGLLELTGEDTQAFLQGQLTNDVKLLTGSNSEYAGYCTAKGRLLATLLLWQQGDAHFAQLDGSIAPAIMKRLGMFVLRSKVKIADASAAKVRIGLSGKNAEAALSVVFPTIPAQPHQLVVHNDAALLRLPGSMPRFEIVAPADAAPALWNQLAPKFKPVGSAVWEWLEIQAGVPQVTAATQEEFVPQMLNLDLLGGISFNKGCYTGQEIVARTHYLGKVKRRTHLAHTAATVAPGDKIFGNDTAEPVGLVVNAASAPQGGFDALAEIRLESVEAGPVRLADGTVLELRDLPYGL